MPEFSPRNGYVGYVYVGCAVTGRTVKVGPGAERRALP